MIPVPPPANPIRWLGGQVDVRVQIDLGTGSLAIGLWDTAEWDVDVWGSVDPDWTDVSEYVISVDMSSGTERWGERFNTGTCSILVDNTTGYFSPGSTAVPPWFLPYRLGRRIRVVAIPDPDNPTVVVPQFTGRLDSSNAGFAVAGYDITALLVCYDFMGTWARFNPLATTPTGAQLTSDRVESALDRMEWVGRDIQTGVHNVQTSDLAQTTLEECQRAADAEGGAFFASPDGLAVFKSRDWLTTDTRSVDIQGYIGYDEVPTGAQGAHLVGDPVTSYELARVANDVQFARDGGTMQHVESLPSQAMTDGPITYQRTDFQNTTDGEVLALAVRYLNSYETPRLRIDSATISAVEDPDNEDLNRLLWGTQLGDRLAVKVDTPYGWEVERELHVMGISHTITGDDWVATFKLDDAQTLEFTYWILQDPAYGVLDQTTRLA